MSDQTPALPEPAPYRAERATAALKHRDFRLLWSGQFVSTLGGQIQTVALGWHIYLLTGSALQLGMLGLMRAIPTIAFSLVGGALADARDRRLLLIVTQGILAAFSAVLAIATQAEFVSVTLIYIVTLLSATADCFDDPARQALIPNLVPRYRLPQALTLNILAGNVATIVGPAVGGVAIASFGLGFTYWLNVASFGAVIAALLVMRSRPAVPVIARGGVHAVIDGLRFVRQNPVILSLMTIDFLATFFGSALVLLPIFASDILDVGPRGLGFLYSAPAFGAVLGGLTLTALPVARKPGRMVLGSIACYGVAIIAFGAAPTFWIALLALGASGVADTVSMTFRHTIRQLATPDHLRGRIAAVHSVFSGGGPELGDFEAGVTARLFGTQPAVIVGGIAVVLVAAGAALFSPRIRDYTLGELERPQPS
ncbi:MAG TPA: MFS transporter [Thermomicrobiales bacterium]|nr:MFS transporter [Thermomicrobiales bacterium]